MNGADEILRSGWEQRWESVSEKLSTDNDRVLQLVMNETLVGISQKLEQNIPVAPSYVLLGLLIQEIESRQEHPDHSDIAIILV